MKKKFLFTALAMCVIFGFVACGGEDEGSGNSSSSSSSSTTSYYISFETANFAVESDSQMVTSVSSVEKNAGDTFTASDIPSFTVRSGYKIAGWYFDAAHTQAFASFSVTEAVRLYGKFTTTDGTEVPTYLVTYNSEYSTHSSQTTDKYIRLQTPTSTKKLFEGWYYDSNYTKRAVQGDTVDKDTTVYAKWISYDAVNAGVGATFSGHDYVPKIDWYTRTTERNNEINDYDYTKATEFSTEKTSTNYYVVGLWSFDNAVLYSSKFDRMHAKVRKGAIENMNMACHYNRSIRSDVPNEVGGKVDMTKIDVFIAVKATGAGTVTASIKTADGETCPTGVTALVNESGTVLAAQKNQTGDARDCTLTANVTSAGNIFLVTSRNEDDSGGIDVYSMNFSAN